MGFGRIFSSLRVLKRNLSEMFTPTAKAPIRRRCCVYTGSQQQQPAAIDPALPSQTDNTNKQPLHRLLSPPPASRLSLSAAAAPPQGLHLLLLHGGSSPLCHTDESGGLLKETPSARNAKTNAPPTCPPLVSAFQRRRLKRRGRVD